MATINLHDVSEEIYDAIHVPERQADGFRWKTIETKTDSVTLFEPWSRAAARRAVRAKAAPAEAT